MRKVLLPITFFAFAPIIIVLSIIQFAYLSSGAKNLFGASTTGIAYAALPTTIGQVSGDVGVTDARTTKVASFFHRYNSVLEQYSQQIVDAADTYGLNYLWLPAIAMQESQGCQKIPAGSYNCWGFGIYTHHTTTFTSYEEAINAISKSIANNYIAKGNNTLEEIQKIWNPANNNNWLDNVKFFMEQI